MEVEYIRSYRVNNQAIPIDKPSFQYKTLDQAFDTQFRPTSIVALITLELHNYDMTPKHSSSLGLTPLPEMTSLVYLVSNKPTILS